MLAYILAVLVGTGSIGLYVAAFFFPEIHRKNDFIWSGVGFFYALALWIYARQVTGGVLVGQTASVALLGWFVWQTLTLRRQLVPANQQTPIPSTAQIQQQLGLKTATPKTPKPAPPTPIPSVPSPVAPAAPPVEVNVPTANPAVEEDEAWIKLEIKPSPSTSQPLGQAVKPPPPPPSTPAQPTQSPSITAETVAKNAPTDAIQTRAELDSEDRG
jgi:hypothetical protein